MVEYECEGMKKLNTWFWKKHTKVNWV